jgi:hypothetical protein
VLAKDMARVVEQAGRRWDYLVTQKPISSAFQ